MYLPEAPWCKASVTLLIYKQKNSERRVPITCWTWRSRESHITNRHEKTRTTVTKQGSKKPVSYTVSWVTTTRPITKDVHMPVGDISKVKGWESTPRWSVPAFDTCWIVQFLLSSNKVTVSLTSCTLTLTALQYSSEAEPYMWLITNLIQTKWCFGTLASSFQLLRQTEWKSQNSNAPSRTGISWELRWDTATARLYHHPRNHLRKESWTLQT